MKSLTLFYCKLLRFSYPTLVIFFFSGCVGDKVDPEGQDLENHALKFPATIKLTEVAPFAWTAVALIPPYFPAAKIENVVGVKWESPKTKLVTGGATDGFYLFIFLNKSTVVREVLFAHRHLSFHPDSAGVLIDRGKAFSNANRLRRMRRT